MVSLFCSGLTTWDFAHLMSYGELFHGDKIMLAKTRKHLLLSIVSVFLITVALISPVTADVNHDNAGLIRAKKVQVSNYV